MWHFLRHHWQGLLVGAVMLQTLVRYWGQFGYETVVLGGLLLWCLGIASMLSRLFSGRRA